MALDADLKDALSRYETERLAQRPTDRALWALGRPVGDCTAHRPCQPCLDDGRIPLPYGV